MEGSYGEKIIRWERYKVRKILQKLQLYLSEIDIGWTRFLIDWFSSVVAKKDFERELVLTKLSSDINCKQY